MPTNTRFTYLYRDADNYKNFGAVVFAGIIDSELRRRFERALDGGEYFIAEQLGVPEVFLWDPDAPDYDIDDEHTWPEELGAGKYKINASDHCWHEFDDFELTADAPTDVRRRTIGVFVSDVENASRAGWTVSNPAARRSFRA